MGRLLDQPEGKLFNRHSINVKNMSSFVGRRQPTALFFMKQTPPNLLSRSCNKIFSNLLHKHLSKHLCLNQSNCCIMRNCEQTVKCSEHASIKLDLVLLHKTARHIIVILSPSCGFFIATGTLKFYETSTEGELESAIP